MLNDVSMLWITENESFDASETENEDEIDVKISFNVFNYFFAWCFWICVYNLILLINLTEQRWHAKILKQIFSFVFSSALNRVSRFFLNHMQCDEVFKCFSYESFDVF